MQEVAALVEQLKDGSNTASWNSRLSFPLLHKERYRHVELGYFEKAPLPLREEVPSEDIPEPAEIIHFDYPDCYYEWKYVASSQPLYPVDVADYVHLLDNIDPSWMLNHLYTTNLIQWVVILHLMPAR